MKNYKFIRYCYLYFFIKQTKFYAYNSENEEKEIDIDRFKLYLSLKAIFKPFVSDCYNFDTNKYESEYSKYDWIEAFNNYIDLYLIDNINELCYDFVVGYYDPDYDLNYIEVEEVKVPYKSFERQLKFKRLLK